LTTARLSDSNLILVILAEAAKLHATQGSLLLWDLLLLKPRQFLGLAIFRSFGFLHP